MKRRGTLIAGILAGVLAMGICLFAFVLVRPMLTDQSRTPSTAAATPAGEIAPESTPVSATPTTPFLASFPTPDPAAAGFLPKTRPELQAPFEVHGFIFESVDLGDGLDHWVAASPDGLALVDIVGAEAVSQASVGVFGPMDTRQDDGAQRTIYMLTMMATIFPSWTEGAAWFADQVLAASGQTTNYETEITQNDIRVSFTVDQGLGAIWLSFEPAGG